MKLNSPDAADSAASKSSVAAATESDTDKIARLEKENASLKAEKSRQSEREKHIAAKTRLGLSRQQAINILDRQSEFSGKNPHRTPEAVAKRVKGSETAAEKTKRAAT